MLHEGLQGCGLGLINYFHNRRFVLELQKLLLFWTVRLFPLLESFQDGAEEEWWGSFVEATSWSRSISFSR